MSRWWLVELHDDLEARQTTRYGVWCGVHTVNGVRSLTDMEAISFETLEELLRADDPELVKLWRKEKQRRAVASKAGAGERESVEGPGQTE